MTGGHVPRHLRTHAGNLLVTLFRGFAFPAGTSSIRAGRSDDGSRTAFIDGLTTAIDVLAIRAETVAASHDYLVLHHASSPVLFSAPGTLVRIDGRTGAAAVIAGCLNRPTAMARDARSGAVYITELIGVDERKARVAKAQRLLREHDMSALLVEAGSALVYSPRPLVRFERFTGAIIPRDGDIAFGPPTSMNRRSAGA